MAAYITRSSLELQLLCKAMGGEPETISGLAGIGGQEAYYALIYALLFIKSALYLFFVNLCVF